MAGNDQIAFYSAVAGLLSIDRLAKPGLARCLSSKFVTDTSSSYNKMERLGKGLVWKASLPTEPGCFHAHSRLAI